ncbi:MAG: 2Fe-2S iron-sulfur cluster-binding protein, partial [bacterium]|nr:2Fe-2S iron-sulfur cluster-binding protein [bacterium]
MHQTALDFLREERGLTGAKEACNEGDCGACLIAVGHLDGARLRYRTMNSCLLPATRLHGKHVVTVEGLAEGGALHPVQQALFDQHGAQCGFCTSGFVMALFCLFLERPTPTREDILRALDGSLCRCTGYASILRAADALAARCRTDDRVVRALRPSYFASVFEPLCALLR